jgi:hypothetical protein
MTLLTYYTTVAMETDGRQITCALFLLVSHQSYLFSFNDILIPSFKVCGREGDFCLSPPTLPEALAIHKKPIFISI